MMFHYIIIIDNGSNEQEHNRKMDMSGNLQQQKENVIMNINVKVTNIYNDVIELKQNTESGINDIQMELKQGHIYM